MSLKQRLYNKLLPLVMWFTAGIILSPLPEPYTPEWWHAAPLDSDPKYD